MRAVFEANFDRYDDADEWLLILELHKIQAYQEGKTISWDLDLNARAPRDLFEIPYLARLEGDAAFAAIAYPNVDEVGFGVAGSVPHDTFTNPNVRSRVIKAVARVHGFVDTLLLQLRAAEQGQPLVSSEVPLRDRN
jgi:hypothetical protein